MVCVATCECHPYFGLDWILSLWWDLSQQKRMGKNSIEVWLDLQNFKIEIKLFLHKENMEDIIKPKRFEGWIKRGRYCMCNE